VTGWIAPGLWFGSLLCKESAMLLPIALAFIPLRPREGQSQSRSRWVMFAPFAVAAAVYLVLRRAALGMWIGGYGADRLSPSPRTLAGTMRHVAYLLVPPLEMIDRGSWIAVAAGVAALLLLVALARYARPLWNTPLVRVGAAWIVVTILPIAALPVSLVTTFNDRLLYLPGIGMACVLAGVLSCIGGRVLLTIGGTAALVLCVWTATIAHRWQIAGALSENSIRQLAASLTGDEQEIYLASVPDSYGGAYMLRSAIPEALQLTGLQHVPRVIVLTRYFVQCPDRLAVTLAVDRMRTGATHVSVRGRDSAPTLLLEDLPPSAGIHRAMLPRLGTDAFDRYLSVEADVPRNSRVLLVGPTRILDEWPPH
jgi:hypothetical protein